MSAQKEVLRKILAGNLLAFMFNFSRQGYESISSLGEVMCQEKHY